MTNNYDKQTRLWMCERKLCHLTEDEAKTHIDVLVAAGTPRRTLAYYRCPVCNHYHVTSNRSSRPNKKQKAHRKRHVRWD